MKRIVFLLSVILVIFLTACKKADDFQLPKLADYYPLQVGKYITYNLDSTVYLYFGAKDTVISYQVKHVIDAQVNDNLGRPGYRIIRYIRKNSAGSWQPDNTFYAVPTENTIEFIENNFRYIKMKEPLRDGFSWKGNSYIDTYSLNSTVKYLDDWDYTYDSLNLPSKIGALMIDSTVKVIQRDETIGNPADANSYSERNIGQEKYAKGIGLVYRVFSHLEYQPPTPGRGGYKQGYGVKLTMIDHN